MKLVNLSDVWSEIQSLPHNGEIVYTDDLDECLKDIPVRMEWIKTSERTPLETDSNEDKCVLAVHLKSPQMYWHWRSVRDNPFDFICWCPMNDYFFKEVPKLIGRGELA